MSLRQNHGPKGLRPVLAIGTVLLLLLSAAGWTGSHLEATEAVASTDLQSGADAEFAGAWEGVYYSHPYSMGLRMTLRQAGDTGFEGDVHFHPLGDSRGVMRAPEGRFRVTGLYDPVLRTFDLKPGEWIERPRHVGSPFRLQGVMDPRQPALTGVFGYRPNDRLHFTLMRPERAAALVRLAALNPPRSSGGRLPNDGGLIRWASRLVEEHPDLEPRRTEMGRLFELAANLFEDEYFRAHFGKTFDQMNARERRSVRDRFARTARISTAMQGSFRSMVERRPNEELRRFNALGRAFDDSVTPGARDVVHMVLARRVTRGWRDGQLARIATMEVAPKSFDELDRLVAAAERHLGTLWPSEQKRFPEDVDRERDHLFAQAAQQIAGSRERVAELLRRNAEQGDAEAQHGLGLLYANSRLGLSPDELNLHRVLVSRGHAGRIMGPDYEQAAYWFTSAAEHGHVGAQSDLGLLYAAGQGVEQNHQLAAMWFAKAAAQGHVFAQHNLASAYAAGRGVGRDQEKAFTLYQHVAEQGFAPSQYEVGRAYEHGLGVARSNARAAEWYRRAAEQGHVHAQNNLGVLYREGRGVGRDEAQAKIWFTRAAEQGSAQARANLGEARTVASGYRETTFWEALVGIVVLGVTAAIISGPAEASSWSDEEFWRRSQQEARWQYEDARRRAESDYIEFLWGEVLR